MSELTVSGTIKKFLEVESGVAKASGNEWQKQCFLVANNDGYEGKEQLFCFEVFGAERVENLTKFQKEGDNVTVKFSVNTNEWKGKYFTSLSSYRIDKVQNETPTAQEEVAVATEPDDLPF